MTERTVSTVRALRNGRTSPAAHHEPMPRFLRDRLNDVTRRISVAGSPREQGVSDSYESSIHRDGKFVGFSSAASDIVSGDLNDTEDVFLHELAISPASAVRINAGGPGLTDSIGREWAADRGFNTGAVATHAGAIAGTVEDVLYQTNRYDPAAAPNLHYAFALTNGRYLVRLHFAENDSSRFQAGRRVFDINVEGARRLEDVDIFAEVGARTALVKSTTVNVTDGQLNIQFLRQAHRPLIAAIEIIPQP
jgi:Malectin domain